MPGVWIMAASPIFLVLSPTVVGSILWQIFLTLGEVIWSPRQYPYVLALAPAGREGVFLALASVKSLLITFPSTWFNGWVNQAFNPNCMAPFTGNCRDPSGHFCNRTAASGSGCYSQHGGVETRKFCAAPSFNMSDGSVSAGWLKDSAGAVVCPATCHDCPGWEALSEPVTLWAIILGTSLLTPLLLWLCLPYLRASGETPQGKQYGILRCGPMRVAGVCGAGGGLE